MLGYSISSTALVTADLNPDHYDIARIKKILKRHDPRYLKQGQTGHLNLSEQDINALLITSLSFFNKQEQRTRARSHLHNERIIIDLSYKLPENQYGQYANISLSLKETPQHLLTIEKLNFGTLDIPGYLVQPLWNFLSQYLYQFDEYRRLTKAVQMVQITQKKLSLTYKADWKAIKQLKQRGQTLLISDSEKYRIRLYQQKLIKIIKQLSDKKSMNKQPGRQVSLSNILQPMFQFALKRSVESQHPTEQSLTNTTSAVEENKALLLVLAVHAAHKNIDDIIGKAITKNTAMQKVRLKTTLRNRIDLMQHFSISAFLASAAGDSLAHATGLFKEISDSKGGSGFSFADLAADQAGIKFGTMAVASELSAYSLQLTMSKITNEDDYMPDINNLPEGLHEAIFKHQYGTPESDRYKIMQYELDRRIELCRLYNDDKK